MSGKHAKRISGPWTQHGHEILGVTIAGAGRPPVARCGGPRICSVCALDVAQYLPLPPSRPSPTLTDRKS